jgi:hypothetical protein
MTVRPLNRERWSPRSDIWRRSAGSGPQAGRACAAYRPAREPPHRYEAGEAPPSREMLLRKMASCSRRRAASSVSPSPSGLKSGQINSCCECSCDR